MLQWRAFPGVLQVQKGQKKGILLIGHGSRDAAGVAELHRLARQAGEHFPEQPCEVGFLEFARPTIGAAFETLLAAGVDSVTAVPMMLLAAGHVKNDIPSELQALQLQHPQVPVRYGRELGVQAPLLRAAQDCILRAEPAADSGYRRADTLLLLVGRGSSDPDANSDIAKIMRFLWEGMGFGWGMNCYSGVTQPLVDEALERACGMGFPSVLVFPYFLFTGRLVKRVYHMVEECQRRFPAQGLLPAPYLKDHALLLEALIERVREAEQGLGNMNCQLCMYRQRLPGVEHRVGEAQQGHHHHVRGLGVDGAPTHGH